jgi:hypothetical protein
MLSCPRWGTGNLKEGRSFSMHLARFCSGPTLLCHAQPGLLQSKRSYEQMQSKLSCTIFQQQIRAFNLMTDVSFPTRNPLHSIPSLHHQSATQSDFEHSNVNYDDFDIDYSAPESLADQPLNNGDAIQVPVIIKCSFQQNTNGFCLILPFKFI